MLLPIPDDWDGTTWGCYQISWPDSILWTALLHGFLSYPNRGRIWDARSGSILGVKAIAAQIWEKNTPLILCSEYPCPDCPDCPDCPPVSYIGSDVANGIGAADDSEDDMGQVVTDVTLEGGLLKVWFGKCCVQSLDLATALSGNAPDIGDDPLNPDGETLTYYPCGKAYSVVELVYLVGQEIYDQAGEWPIYWVRNVKNAFPDVELTDADIIRAVLAAQSIVALGTIVDYLGASRPAEEVVFDDYSRQSALCQIVDLFAADALGVDATTYDEIKDSITGQFGYNLLLRTFWSYVISAIGQGDLDNIAKLGALDSTRDCTCPEGWTFGTYIDEEAFDWVITFDFRTTAPPVGTTYSSQSPLDPVSGHYYAGKGIVSGISDISGRNQLKINIPILNAGSIPACTLQRVGLRYQTRIASEYKGQASDHVIGTNGITAPVPVSLLDTFLISSGGSFAFNAGVNDEDIGADEWFTAQVDFTNVPVPWDDDDREYSNVIEAIYFAGTGPVPVVLP